MDLHGKIFSEEQETSWMFDLDKCSRKKAFNKHILDRTVEGCGRNFMKLLKALTQFWKTQAGQRIEERPC